MRKRKIHYPPKIDHERMLKYWIRISAALEALPKEERNRVIKALQVFYEA